MESFILLMTMENSTKEKFSQSNFNQYNDTLDLEDGNLSITVVQSGKQTGLTYDPYGMCDFTPLICTSPYILAESGNLPKLERGHKCYIGSAKQT